MLVGRNKLAQFRPTANALTRCRNCASLFRPTFFRRASGILFGLAPGRVIGLEWKLEMLSESLHFRLRVDLMNRLIYLCLSCMLGLLVGCDRLQQEKEIAKNPKETKNVPAKKSDVSEADRQQMKKAANRGPDRTTSKKTSAVALANRFSKRSKGAEKDDRHSMGTRILMGLDKNKDGKLQKDEIPKSLQRRLMPGDSNRDGELTKSELQRFQNGMQGLPTAGGGGTSRSQAGSQRGAGLGAALGQLDKNKDGKVELKELDEGLRNSVASYDTNGDGILSQNELSFGGGGGKMSKQSKQSKRPPGPGGSLPGGGGGKGGKSGMMQQLMASMDRNGDGKISADELPLAIRAGVMAADKDKDGFISGDEFQQSMQTRNGQAGGSNSLVPSQAPKDAKARMKALEKKKPKKKPKKKTRSRSRRRRRRR